jgi:hypothetical protein
MAREFRGACFETGSELLVCKCAKTHFRSDRRINCLTQTGCVHTTVPWFLRQRESDEFGPLPGNDVNESVEYGGRSRQGGRGRSLFVSLDSDGGRSGSAAAIAELACAA